MGAISSETTKESDSSILKSYNPATGEILGQVPITPSNKVFEITTSARKAQALWAQKSVAERCHLVKNFRDLLTENMEEICVLLSQETGKPKTEALLTEVLVVIDHATYFIKQAPSILKERSVSLHLLKNRSSYLHHTPRGVVGIISPWNFPFSIPLCETFMALIAGNAVVLKPSEITPLVAQKAKEYFDASKMPSDLFQVIYGKGDTGAALIDSGIDYCIFTGSTETGRKIAAACGERLIPCILELGGKSPALVCADANIKRTAKALVWGSFAHSGQVCASIERAYIHQDLYEPLLQAIKEEVHCLRQGDPMSNEVDLGSMTWNKQREKVHQQVLNAVEQGASIITGGNLPKKNGLFYPPTVLANCNQGMEIMQKEIFGPILPIMKVSSNEEGISLCNNSAFGLMGYLFTQNTHLGKQLAQRIRAGTVMVNDTLITFAAPETPWGGMGISGIGRTHSNQGLKDLCHLQHVNYDRIRLKRELWWFPYREKFYEFVKKLIRHFYK